MVFGLCNAPVTFERLVEKILRDLLNDICLIYLDDVMVMAKSFDEMLDNLHTIFVRIRNANLKLNKKMHFLSTRGWVLEIWKGPQFKTGLYYMNEWIKIYLFHKEDESEIIEFYQYRRLVNKSKELHTTMSIKTHLHIKATRLFSTQVIYDKAWMQDICIDNTYNEVIMEKIILSTFYQLLEGASLG